MLQTEHMASEPPVSEILQVQELDAPPPKAPYLKILSTGLSFFVAGINDGSLGSLIPYIMETYDVSTNMVSILYGCTFVGWVIAAFSNGSMTRFFDLGWMLTIGATLQITAHALRCWGPPLPLYAVAFSAASLGQAFNDTHANTFVSSLEGSHRYLGFIHAMYMAGCLIGPLVATALATSVSDSHPTSRWTIFYVFPLGLGIVNLALVTISFRDRFRLGANIKENAPPTSTSELANGKSAWTEIKVTLSTPSVWLLSLFFFFFLGASITAGGWLVEYLTTVRGGNIASIGYVLTGFYGGGFLGRLALAEPTYRLGQRRMILIYALICVALQLVFWLVPNIIVEAVAICLLGFFMGPFFATGINVGTRIFPPEVRSSSIAFVFVLSQIGGSVLPAITGIIAAKKGVQVLQPMLLGLLGASAVSWLILPSEHRLHRD